MTAAIQAYRPMYGKNRAFYTGDLLLEIRLDLKFFVTGFQRPDSQYKTAEPFLYMSHHGVVPEAAESIPQLRIIPELRQVWSVPEST